MSNKVYTYSNITELKNAPFYRDIMVIPQITVSRQMSINLKHMVFGARDDENGNSRSQYNICSFTTFMTRLFPNWNDSTQRFLYMTELNHFLRERIEHTRNKAEKEWLFGCKKNLYSAISNIIRLEEAHVAPEDIKADDRDMRLFVEMWNRVTDIKSDNSKKSIIKDFRDRTEKLMGESADFDVAVNAIFRFRGQKKIILHGFQYLTPMQQFIFDLFTKAGYDIYALIQCEERYPYANEIWDNLYDGKNGFPPKSYWIRQEDMRTPNALGEIFEHGDKVSANNVKLIKYENTFEFVKDVQRIKDEGFYMYSADDKSANKMLKDYYPEHYEARNLLAYPVGQFIYTLHKMWDENRQCLVLDADGLRKCFASGWLSINHESSMNYTEDLERMLPYFEGCYTVDDWNNRLLTYMDAFDNAIDVFAVEPTDDKVRDRKLEILGNPFRHFGAYSIREDRIETVLAIIKRLMDMARKLFASSEPVSIYEHLNKLDSILCMNDGMPPGLYQEEKKRVKQIFDVLESDRIKDFLCYPGDIAATMLSFMDGNLDDEETKDRLRNLVFNIFQVDSALISAKGKVHICLADINKLPGPTGVYSWPMDEKVLENVSKLRDDTYVANWIESTHITSLGNRYYIYAALKNPEVEISWVENQSDKVLSPSPYITLLDKLSDSKITSLKDKNLSLEYVTEVIGKGKIDKDFNMRINRELHMIDSDMEYAKCPMSFVYSYVLGDNPTYVNTYQQSRALIRFIQILARKMKGKYTIDQIANEVLALFPNIRKAEKRQMLDYAKGRMMADPEIEYTVFEGKKYSNYRLEMIFPDADVYDDAMHFYADLLTANGRSGVFADRIGYDGSHNCETCPHQSYCRDSLFGIDYKEDSV